MAGELDFVNTGQMWKGAIVAKTWNAFIDSARFTRQQRQWTSQKVERWSDSTFGITNITFIIVSAGSTTCLGKVISWVGDGTIEDIPGDINHLAGISTALGVVQVCDAKGCVFDEPPDQLFGRVGTANYRNVNVAGVCRSGYGPWAPVWEADTLCCKKPTCAFLGGT